MNALAGFISPTPETFQSHRLHAQDRCWPETNCYVDLWIEILAACGFEPEAMLGFTAALDWAGDQFVFPKPPLSDLELGFGVRVDELAIWDGLVGHIVAQLSRGNLCLVEVDGFWLPDTASVSYRREHVKTTVAVCAISPVTRSAVCLHNAACVRVSGEDFDGAFAEPELVPYVETVRFSASPPDRTDIRAFAETNLARHRARRPQHNPVRAFQAELEQRAETLAARDPALFHRFAFHTLRQLGSNFELLADHLNWLYPDAAAGCARHCLTISETARAVQFRMARAFNRRRFDGLALALEPAAESWDALFQPGESALAA